ncbi:MAG: phosphoglycerate mutase [Balneola sp.]|nr:MAG: phosphoglycerate mutase [Balneola sp.]
MRKSFQTLILLSLFILAGSSALQAFQIESTTLIFVRHAEKASDGTRNPPLDEKGEKRASNLYKSLSDFDIKAVFSTPYKRTEMTAKPTADSLDLEINTYGFENIEQFLENIIVEYRGGAVLIVGHSNTTPALVNMVLGSKEYEQIDESQYGDMFIVTTKELGNATVDLKSF